MSQLHAHSTKIGPRPLRESNSVHDVLLQFPDGGLTTREMGVQSQKRISAIKKCRKLGSLKKTTSPTPTGSNQSNLVQTVVDNTEERAFSPKRDCPICRAVDKGWRIPHRAHHKLCEGNRTTRGSSATEVASDRYSAKLKKHFSAVMKSAEEETKLHGGKAPPSVKDFFQQPSIARQSEVDRGDIDMTVAVGATVLAEKTSSKMLAPSSSQQEVAMFLEQHVASRLAGLDTARLQHKAPPAMLALAEAIMEQVTNKKPIQVSGSLPTDNTFKLAYGRFQAIFGANNIVYKVPYIRDCKRSVDPNFHSLAGSQFIYMDLELAFPEFRIACYWCSSTDLVRRRDCYSHNKTLIPIVTDDNEIWCRPFKYKCNKCSLEFETNEGPFLASLPAFIRNQYPVDPRYAKKGNHSHLSKTLSRHLEEHMLSHSNAKRLVENTWKRKQENYVDKCEDYFSRPKIGGDYPLLDDVIRTYPPSDQDCRDLYLSAQESTLNPEQMSANDRHERIMQSTRIEELMAIDWTFETLKNYRLVGAKAIFTILNEKGQICSFVIVPTEKLAEVDHMLIAMSSRRGINFHDGKPRGLYTDTWPNSKTYWDKRLGPATRGTLGLFHFGKRLLDHLNPKHTHFYMVKDRLQRCVYRYNQSDIELLMKAFSDGSITKPNGEKYSNQEVDELRLSKAWTRNYTKYLRKEILRGDEVDRNLHDFGVWLVDLVKAIPGGDELFVSSLGKFQEQIVNNRKHSNHIQDPEGIEMYRGVQPGKKAHIHLLRWLSKRPESLLEMFHGLMKHFGNTAMRPELADSLTLRGAAEYNLEREHKVEKMNRDTDDCCLDSTGRIPEHLCVKPRFYNHAILHHVNELARCQGRSAPFPNYKAMPPNNGEVFLSKYFKQQLERNKRGQTVDGFCSCDECKLCETIPTASKAVGTTSPTTGASARTQIENDIAADNIAESVRNTTCCETLNFFLLLICCSV